MRCWRVLHTAIWVDDVCCTHPYELHQTPPIHMSHLPPVLTRHDICRTYEWVVSHVHLTPPIHMCDIDLATSSHAPRLMTGRRHTRCVAHIRLLLAGGALGSRVARSHLAPPRCGYSPPRITRSAGELMYESCHRQMSHATHECVTHSINEVTCESCRNQMSHVTHEWVMHFINEESSCCSLRHVKCDSINEESQTL